MIQGVFFDLFGTLLIYTNMRKAWDDWLLVLHENFIDFGLEMSRDSLALKCNGFFKRPKPYLNIPNLTIFETRIYNLGLELGLKLESEELRKTAGDTIKAWKKYVPLDPDTLPVLKALKKNKTLALISNFDHPPYVYSLLTDLKLRAFFDSIVISGEVNIKKPDPLIFSFALEETHLKPNEVCYVGDTEEDIEGAINANICPILIQRNSSSKDDLIDDFYQEKLPITQSGINIDLSSVKVIKNLKELIDLTN
ncbi:MAG: HAD family hydrolase [Promethearchaeota archaeon]|jgi:HAD superfamily hydrolase (TIGR01549 family)